MKMMVLQHIQHFLQTHGRKCCLLLVVIALTIPLVIVIETRTSTTRTDAGTDVEDTFDHFRLKDVSVIKVDADNKKCFSLRADKILHRMRKTRFFTYYN